MVAMIGVDGSYDQTVWAQMHSFEPGALIVRPGDLTPTVGPGTREAVTAAGWVRACGCLGKLTSATVSLAANGGANNRLDYRVAEFNWRSSASPLGTAAKSVEVKTVQGGSGGALPALLNTPGDIVQVPLGLYTVPTGGGAITVIDTRPLERVTRVYDSVIDTAIGVGGNGLAANADPVKVAQIVIPHQGGQFRVLLQAVVGFAGTATGKGRLYAYIDDGTGDALIANGQAGSGNSAPAVLAPAKSPVYTSKVTARLFAGPNSMTSPDKLIPVAFGSSFACLAIPA